MGKIGSWDWSQIGFAGKREGRRRVAVGQVVQRQCPVCHQWGDVTITTTDTREYWHCHLNGCEQEYVVG